MGEVEEQAREMTRCFDLLAAVILPDSLDTEIEASLHEAKALNLLGRWQSCSVTEFANALHITLSTASHTIDQLVKKRAVKRTRSVIDRRVVRVALSGKGLKRHREFFEHRSRAWRALLNHLSAADREHVMGTMKLLAQAAEFETKKRSAPPSGGND